MCFPRLLFTNQHYFGVSCALVLFLTVFFIHFHFLYGLDSPWWRWIDCGGFSCLPILLWILIAKLQVKYNLVLEQNGGRNRRIHSEFAKKLFYQLKTHTSVEKVWHVCPGVLKGTTTIHVYYRRQPCEINFTQVESSCCLTARPCETDTQQFLNKVSPAISLQCR